MSTITLRVALNGTSVNPYDKWGLKQNPIPQLGRREHDAACLQLQKLGGDPIPENGAEKYIRTALQGWDEEFVALCVSRYKPGEYVVFAVKFPEDS